MSRKTYSVTISILGRDEIGYEGLMKNQAIGIARRESKKNPNANIFISFFRSTDSQTVYLNPTGDFSPVGKSW